MDLAAGPGLHMFLAAGDVVPLWIIDPTSLAILHASPAMATALVRPADDLRCLTLHDLVAPDHVPCLRDTLSALAVDTHHTGLLRLRMGELWSRPVAMQWHLTQHDDRPAVLGILGNNGALTETDATDQQRLREQAANLDLVQQLMAIGFWRMEVATGRLRWSDNIYRIIGRPPGTFDADLGTLLKLTHPADRAETSRLFENFMASEETRFDFTHRIILPDGNIRHMRGIAERGVGGNDGWLSGIVQDITRDVRARAEVDRADRMQRIAKKVARLGWWRLGFRPLQIEWSPETCAMHDEPEGKQLELDAALEYYLPSDRERIRAAVERCSMEGMSFDEVAQIITAKGRHLWVRVIGEAERDADGAVIGAQGAFQDITELVAMRDESDKLARRLQHTLESINDSFLIIDHDWCFAFLNRRAEALLQSSSADLIGRNVWEAFPTAAGTVFQQNYELAVETGRSVRFQAHFAPLDLQLEVDVHPTSEGLAIYFRDITAEHARAEHLRLLEAAVSQQDNMLIILEGHPVSGTYGRPIVYVNNAFVRRTGYSREEVIGRTPDMMYGPNTQPDVIEDLRAAMQRGEAVNAEMIHYTKAGKEFWQEVDMVPVIDDTGQLTHWVGIERDITDRKHAEEALQRSDERFRLVARATNDVVWDWDLEADTIWWNENCESLFGHDPAQLSPGPESWTDHIHIDDKNEIVGRVYAALAGSDTTWVGEYRYCHADGHIMTVIDRAFIIRDIAGKAVRMIGSMIDVTKQRETEARLNQAQKLEAVGQLTGGVAHDFNNLLTVILGNAEALSERLEDKEARRLAEMTASAAERGAALTKRLLAFSRKQPLQPRLLDISKQVDGMEELLRRALAEHIDIRISHPRNVWQTALDPSQLEAALLNLALNARDAMPGGGYLTIETANVAVDEEHALPEDDLPPGDYVRVSVSDTGEGIAADALPHIFEPFFTTKDVGKGSGLGLSMVYGFVKQSGGHVRVYSELGEGTVVKMYFPRSRLVDRSGRGQMLARQIVGGNELILVVEDNALVREYLVGQLKALGYRVEMASSGIKALELLDTVPGIDLLFTDVMMPGGMNGQELAQIARSRQPDLKLLFTSGYSENAFAHSGRLDLPIELLSKPYRRDQLASKLRKVLDR